MANGPVAGSESKRIKAWKDNPLATNLAISTSLVALLDI
jgi:hypothetical protein